MAKLSNSGAAAFVMAALALTTITLQACKFRSMNGTLNSEPSPGDVEFTGFDLKTRGGREAADFFNDVNGAVYIGEISFVRKRDKIITNNPSFFEGEAIETVLADLEKSLQPGQTPQHFAFKGCKKERQSEINNALLAAFKSDRTDLKDAFVANYSRVWKTEDLSSDKESDCLKTLLSKEELEFSFFIKPPETNGQSRQLLVVRAGNNEKPAVFESLHPIPQGRVIVILRNDSWGRSKPKIAILPTDRPFNEEEQMEALYAHGWINPALPLRDNALADAILRGRPKTLADLSGRFAALSHYGDIGGAAAKGAVGILVVAGFGMAATTAPAVVHAVTTAMTSHTFGAAQLAPVVPFVQGVTSGLKGICDLAEVSKKADLDEKGGVWKRREKYCFVINLLFGVTTAAQAFAMTPIARQAIGGAFQAAIAQAPAITDNLKSLDPQQVNNAVNAADRFHSDIKALLDSLALGLTNLQAVGYASARTLFNAVENITSQLEKVPGLHEALDKYETMRGLTYGMSIVERASYRCNTVLDLQQLKLGNNAVTRMLNWPGCFRFLRAAYVAEGKRAGLIDDQKLWRDFAASDPLSENKTKLESMTFSDTESTTDPIAAAEAKNTAAGARLKQIITSEKGKSALLRSAAQEPWSKSGNDDAAYNELGRKIWKDIESCEVEVRQARDAKPELNLCGPKQSKACLYTCARSALHQIRNTYFPIEYLYCLEAKAEGTTESCTFKYDIASDDGISLPGAVKSGTAERFPDDDDN